MSIFSEITAEQEVLAYCREIEKCLQTEKSSDAIRVFKQIGRFALTRFDWDTPKWAEPYQKLFED